MERISYTTSVNLDALFGALADPTRRAILAQLAQGEASVGDLAEPFAISQPAISRHLRVLETAGLIDRRVDRQRRIARLRAEPMADAVKWLTEFRAFWDGNLDALDTLLTDLQTKEPRHD